MEAATTKQSGGGQTMAHKPMERALASPGVARHGGGLSRLAASGIYQFRGSGGEKVTIINKEKLRTSTAGISGKGKK